MALILCSNGKAEQLRSSSENDSTRRIAFAFHKDILDEADIKDVKAAMAYWFGELGNNYNATLEWHIYDDITIILNGVENGHLDVVNIPLLEYFRYQESLNLDATYAALQNGKKTRQYVLITRMDTSISHVKDLANKRLAIFQNDVMGLFYANLLLLRNNLKESRSFFSSISEKRKFSQAILSVFFGQADACIATDMAFNTMVELNPQVGRKLKIIASSPELVSIAGFFRRNFDPELKKEILDVMYNLQQTVRGKQILLSFKIDRFVPAMESDMDALRDIFNEYEQLVLKNQTVSEK